MYNVKCDGPCTSFIPLNTISAHFAISNRNINLTNDIFTEIVLELGFMTKRKVFKL